MTTKQRAKLRAMCNTMEPILHIGKDGITDNLIKQCWDALEARELIKVQVLNTAPSRCKPSAASSASTARRGRTPRSDWRICNRTIEPMRGVLCGAPRFVHSFPTAVGKSPRSGG